MGFIIEDESGPETEQGQVKGDFSISDAPPQEVELTKAQAIFRKVEPFAEPALEAGLSTLGAILFAPLAPPFGSVGGGAGGFALAKSIEDVIEDQLGLRERQPVVQDFIDTGKDLATGTTLEIGGQAGGKIITNTLGKILAPESARMTDDAVKRLKLSKRLGVEVSAAEITQSKPLALMESLLDKIAFSSGVIQDKRLLQLKSLSRLRQSLLDRGGSNEAVEETGKRIQESVDTFLKELSDGQVAITKEMRDSLLERLGTGETFESLGLSGKAILKRESQIFQDTGAELFTAVGVDIPKGTVVDTTNFRQVAIRELRKQLKVSPGLQDKTLINKLKQMSGLTDDSLAIINQIPEAQQSKFLSQVTGDVEWQGVQGNIQALNDLIKTSDFAVQQGQAGVKGLSSTAGGTYKMLKKALIKDVTAFSNKTGGKVKENLDIANAFWSEGKKVYNSPIIKRMLKSNPEKLIDMVVTPGDVTNIKLFQKATGKAGEAILKKGFSKKLLEGFKNGRSFISTLDRFSDDTLGQIYSPKEITQLRALGNLDIQGQKALVSNPFFRTLVKQSPEKVIDFIVKPNNVGRLNMIETIVGKAGMRDIAAKHLERVLALNRNELFSPSSLVTQLKKFGDRTMSKLLSPEVWRDLQRLGDVSQIARGAELLAGNPSGTAQNLISFVTGGIVLKDPIGKAWLIALPNLLARLYSSKTALRWLTEGVQLPTGSKRAATLFTKLAGVTGVSHRKRKDEEQRRRRSISGLPAFAR